MKLTDGFREIAGKYLEDQARDVARFIIQYVVTRGLPEAGDLDELVKLAVEFVAQHGTATPEAVAAFLAEHDAPE